MSALGLEACWRSARAAVGERENRLERLKTHTRKGF